LVLLALVQEGFAELVQQVQEVLEAEKTASSDDRETKERSVQLVTGEGLTIVWNAHDREIMAEFAYRDENWDEPLTALLRERLLRLNARERFLSGVVYGWSAEGQLVVSRTLTVEGSDRSDRIVFELEELFLALHQPAKELQIETAPGNESAVGPEESPWTRI
jgi:hypothetical protein